MAASEATVLQYQPFSSYPDPAFWHELVKLKLNVFKLSDDPVPLTAFFTNSDASGLPSRLNVEYSAFNTTAGVPAKTAPAAGQLRNTNTLEEFRDSDKQALLQAQARHVWEDLVSGRAVEDSSLLARFLLYSFADLKKHKFYYWFCFPAHVLPCPATLVSPVTSLAQAWSPEQVGEVRAAVDGFLASHPRDVAFWLAVPGGEESGARGVTAHPLSQARTVLGHPHAQVYAVVVDPGTLPDHPGWPARNLVTLLALTWGRELSGRVQLLCWRDRTRQGERQVDHSLLLTLNLPPLQLVDACPGGVGWERNHKHKLLPRVLDLSSSMNPERLAGDAVDLNLRLMRWRLMPQLDLSIMTSCRCLLLGAGTLGCNVARALLGWGVRNITLVDSGRVSYSNPVRQTLFTFADCAGGGRYKAEAAADTLRQIFPGVAAEAVVMSIPMPGHSVSEAMTEETRATVTRLEGLVTSHDVVFLLTDTRESRWLPTVMGCAHGKLVMNAALGFDTYLVMRHGYRRVTPHDDASCGSDAAGGSAAAGGADAAPRNLKAPVPGSELGCYFCNDVVAPGNSTRDRSLDQQCTVSRPGSSMMAAALLVEMTASVLQHPLRGEAPAAMSGDLGNTADDSDSCLGIVPHQMRGYLSQFQQLLLATRAFPQCIGCSPLVVERYGREGFDFLMRVFNESKFLEEATGLDKLFDEADMAEIWALSDSDSITSSS